MGDTQKQNGIVKTDIKKEIQILLFFLSLKILKLIAIFMIIPLNVIETLDLSSVLEVILLLLIVSFKQIVICGLLLKLMEIKTFLLVMDNNNFN
jgi:hypothetical protein